MPRRFLIKTLGCKVNQYESRALEEALAAGGFNLAEREGDAPDVVVINTCTVTHRSDRDARALLYKARREHPGAKLVVAGCAAQVDPQSFVDLGADLVVGTAEKARLAELILTGATGIRAGLFQQAPLQAEPVARFTALHRAFLKVQDGCDAGCAYCIVPLARGPSRSLPPKEVSAGLKRLGEGGHCEVVLTGIHLGFWGRDLSPRFNFNNLLELAENSGIPRLRLSSLEPLELTGEVVARLKVSESLCPHLHIPLQSGSDRVLARMGRPYTADAFRENVERALSSVPGLCLGFDVIVGFPGETEEDFEATAALLEALPFCYLHVFPFSSRKGTAAADMGGQVPEEVKQKRAARLRELSRAKKVEFYSARIGTEALALSEGFVANGTLRVRTRDYVEADIPWTGAEPEDEFRVNLLAWDGKRLVGNAGEAP